MDPYVIKLAELGMSDVETVGGKNASLGEMIGAVRSAGVRVPDGFARDPANDRILRTYGVSYKPHPNVVLKVDWQDESNAAGTGQDQLNFAVGYLF